MEKCNCVASFLEKYVPTWGMEVFLVFGVLFLLKQLWGILNFIYVYFLRPRQNLRKYGSWAIITGATDCIGKAIAEDFAKLKFNIILISRTQTKLDEVAKELRDKFNVQTKTVAVDCASSSPTIWDPVRAAIQDLDIGILINNVGMSYDYPEFFSQSGTIQDRSTHSN